jgi:nucleotide-binding universal stress UspA family protein
MDAIETILAPTDFSKASEPGVRYALEMAASVDAEVIVYHVVQSDDDFPYPLGIGEVSSAYLPQHDLDELVNDRKKALESFVHDHFKDLLSQAKVSLNIDLGEAQDMILQKAEQDGIDMIVMSTHGRTGLGHILIGSITEHVVRRARCPVLSIRAIEKSG